MQVAVHEACGMRGRQTGAKTCDERELLLRRPCRPPVELTRPGLQGGIELLLPYAGFEHANDVGMDEGHEAPQFREGVCGIGSKIENPEEDLAVDFRTQCAVQPARLPRPNGAGQHERAEATGGLRSRCLDHGSAYSMMPVGLPSIVMLRAQVKVRLRWRGGCPLGDVPGRCLSLRLQVGSRSGLAGPPLGPPNADCAVAEREAGLRALGS
jgi:hypothetical protein